MPWYKVDVRHGPGHQSSGLPGVGCGRYSYVYFNKILTDEERKQEYDYLVEDLDYPMGEMTLVTELPPHELKWEIKQCKSRIAFERDKLKELQKMKKEMEGK